MDALKLIITILQLLCGLAIILAVLIQSGKNAGLSGSIAGVADTFMAKGKAKSVDAQDSQRIYRDFIIPTEDENGALKDIKFKNTESFNFGFDIVDEIAEKYPQRFRVIDASKTLDNVIEQVEKVANELKKAMIYDNE